MNIDRMQSNGMRENNFCKDFSPEFISHVRCHVRFERVLFYYAEWQTIYSIMTIILINYNTTLQPFNLQLLLIIF